MISRVTPVAGAGSTGCAGVSGSLGAGVGASGVVIASGAGEQAVSNRPSVNTNARDILSIFFTMLSSKYFFHTSMRVYINQFYGHVIQTSRVHFCYFGTDFYTRAVFLVKTAQEMYTGCEQTV